MAFKINRENYSIEFPPESVEPTLEFQPGRGYDTNRIDAKLRTLSGSEVEVTSANKLEAQTWVKISELAIDCLSRAPDLTEAQKRGNADTIKTLSERVLVVKKKFSLGINPVRYGIFATLAIGAAAIGYAIKSAAATAGTSGAGGLGNYGIAYGASLATTASYALPIFGTIALLYAANQYLNP